ncbi:uncharacterized protein BJ212DRAFT_1311487, partial [Suillus subaureus]
MSTFLLSTETKDKAFGRLLQDIIAYLGDITAIDWVGQLSNFNSCLSAEVPLHKALPYTLPSLS